MTRSGAYSAAQPMKRTVASNESIQRAFGQGVHVQVGVMDDLKSNTSAWR